jgi:hypothetical protein
MLLLRNLVYIEGNKLTMKEMHGGGGKWPKIVLYYKCTGKGVIAKQKYP